MIINYSYNPEFKKDFNKITRIDKAEELLDLDGIGSQLDVNEFSRKFFSKKQTTADVSVDANSNIDDISVVQYEAELAKPLQRLNAYFLLWKYSRQLMSSEIANKMLEAQFTKKIYINDFHRMSGSPYCFNFSCMDVVCQGLPFVKKIKSGPPKHLSSFMGQMIQFITYACNSIAGAVGLADLLICSSYYVDKEREKSKGLIDEKYFNKLVKQELQSFIYSVNQPFRGAQQSPFTNISIYDDVFLTKLCSEYQFPDGTKPNKETVKFLQDMFIDLMNETLKVTPATFPVTTACIAVDDNKEILDKDFVKHIAKKNLEFGFMNIYCGKTSTLSSCCRLRSETENEYFNMFGSGGTKIGSLGVVTLNLPQIAFTSESEEEFIEKLKDLVELISQINHVKRHIVKKRIESNHSPLYSLGFINIDRQYSTCGLVGINEVVEIFGKSILKKDGQALVKRLLDTVNEVNERQQKRYEYPHNVEQVPAENSAIKLAKADKILGYNEKYEIYSNQFVPLTTKADMFDRIKLQGMFDEHMTGGAILHLNVEDKITDVKFMENLIIESVKAGVIYFAVNYNLQQCKNEHMTVGKNKKCPVCASNIVSNFTRVVGFLVNVSNWHSKRREWDYPERKWYDN